MSTYLPEAIVTNILQRLHIKTLLHCTSVCKTWYSLITSSHFISTHLNFNNNRTPHLLIGYCKNCISRDILNYSLHYDDQTFESHTHFGCPFKSFHGCFYVVGSFNGLVCIFEHFMDGDDRFIIWNPFLNKAFYIRAPFYLNHLYDDSYEPSIGFGLDFTTNDYKMVSIVRVGNGEVYPKVEVYRFSTRVWEDKSCLALPYFIVGSSTYLNGAVHWIGTNKEGCKYTIVLFDMHSEVFREMMLPSTLTNAYTLACQLFCCQGSLRLLHDFSYAGGDLRFDIWLMKEYGAADSWIKQFVVDISSLRRPLSFRNNGEILWETSDGKLISYDPQTKEMKDLHIPGVERFEPMLYFYGGTYVESLVLLDEMVDVLTCHKQSSVERMEENHESSKGRKRKKSTDENRN